MHSINGEDLHHIHVKGEVTEEHFIYFSNNLMTLKTTSELYFSGRDTCKF